MNWVVSDGFSSRTDKVYTISIERNRGGLSRLAGLPQASLLNLPRSLNNSIKTDIKNAGAYWQNKKVVVDDGLIASRQPSDIPAFNKAIIKILAKAKQKLSLIKNNHVFSFDSVCRI
ncbi:MAG: DJ-1/PfpI family protein [Gammaproteobacteria bacterium]|nr:DJ-1/PfpI family protein [Gammaproteobacteria bacterium]